jgi:hypothetical protein
MKHLNNYEEFNESLLPGGASKMEKILNIPLIPFNLLIFGLSQFLNGRFVNEILFENWLDIYTNIDVVRKEIDKLKNEDLTDSEQRKADKILKEIERCEKKYPTLEDFKKHLMKLVPLVNFKNKDFLKKKIETYESNELSYDKLYKILKKINDKMGSSAANANDQLRRKKRSEEISFL